MNLQAVPEQRRWVYDGGAGPLPECLQNAGLRMADVGTRISGPGQTLTRVRPDSLPLGRRGSFAMGSTRRCRFLRELGSHGKG